MIKGLFHSSAGMIPRFFKLAAISNNLANANSTAFKADRVHFGTVLNNELTQPGEKGMPARQIEREMSYSTDFAQGALERTGEPAQFALDGNGFFVLESPETGEQFYTRNGNFHLNAERELVSTQGLKVMQEGGSPVMVDGNDFLVAENGEYLIDGKPRGKIQVMMFEDLTKLLKRGDTLFTPESDRVIPEAASDVRVMQGYLETSNVNPVHEMVEMIALNRNYESSQKILVAQDESLKKLIQQVPKFS